MFFEWLFGQTWFGRLIVLLVLVGANVGLYFGLGRVSGLLVGATVIAFLFVLFTGSDSRSQF